MASLPPIDLKTGENPTPHVVILGAGASRAAFPEGDVSGKKLPLMNDIVKVIGLEDIIGASEGSNFEEIYSRLIRDQDLETARAIEDRVWDYFERMQIPDELTLYDELVMSLRSKDIIATFNWDPLLLQAYRRSGFPDDVPDLAFLHGNVAKGICYDDKRVGFLGTCCSVCHRLFQRGKLLFPIQNKDYADDLVIRDEWESLQYKLRESFIVTVFGYSTPEYDAKAMDLMTTAWKDNNWFELGEIEIIDIRDHDELEREWNGLLAGEHYGIFDSYRFSLICRHPRRSCDHFASAVLRCHPWRERPIPEGLSLDQYKAHIRALIEEERRVKGEGIPFNDGREG